MNVVIILYNKIMYFNLKNTTLSFLISCYDCHKYQTLKKYCDFCDCVYCDKCFINSNITTESFGTNYCSECEIIFFNSQL